MTEQNFVYECSRGNAQTQISNSEWINEWNEGIKLEAGDTVRLLGSFISEVGDGNDISIEKDTKFTLDFKPYINAETVAFGVATHSNIAGKFQFQLGDIAQPAYYTDNFGTEPPYTMFDLSNQPNNKRIQDAAHQRLQSDRFSMKLNYGQYSAGDTLYNVPDDDAVKAGAFFDTASGTANITTADVTNQILVNNTLSTFNQKNLPQEFQIGHLCKLIKIPIFHGLQYETTQGVYEQHSFDPAEILQVGDYISTYHVGNYPTVDPTTPLTSVYKTVTNDSFGTVKWEAGPQSVVGKVVATKFVYKQIYEPISNTTYPMEFQYIYVQDFINPAQYKNSNDLDGTLRAPRHGASELENGYNTYRNNNQLTGFSNSNNTGGHYFGTTPIATVENNYLPQMTNNNLVDNQELTGNVTQRQNMLGNTNAGLSFLWGAKGMWGLKTYNDIAIENDNGVVYPGFTSWIKWQPAVTGVWTALNGTNMREIAIGEASFIIGCNDSFQTLRTLTMNVGSFFGNSPSTSMMDLINLEEVAYQTDFHSTFNHYYNVTLSLAVGVNFTAGELNIVYQRNLGGYDWMPKQFTFNYQIDELASTTNTIITHTPSGEWNDVGAIVQIDPNNDNVAYNEPTNPAYKKRLYIPFNEQKVNSPYKTRNFGAGGNVTGPPEGGWEPGDNFPQFPVNAAGISSCNSGDDRLRYNFGTGCAWEGGGDFRDSANRTLPFPYGVVSGTTAWCFWDYNLYNEQCVSVYFQNENGNISYPQPTTNDDINNDILFKQDLIYIKTYKSEFNIPAGFYSPQRMADLINDQLHFGHLQYNQEVGTNTTVGSRERAKTNGNGVIYGNFIHTYLPELSFGFLPITPTVFSNLGSPTNLHRTTDNVNTLFKSYGLDNQNPTLANVQNGYDYYTVPYNQDAGEVDLTENGFLSCFRLIGSRILQTAAGNEMDNIDPSVVYNNRIIDALWQIDGESVDNQPEPAFVFYQNRGYKNRLMYGGAAKCWVGAVNPTFSFDAEMELFNWSFLYTPYRPAADESGQVLTLTGGEAVPSAIINSFTSGEITESLSGIYITNLRGAEIASGNSPQFFDMFNSGYPAPIANYISVAQNFWKILGYSNTLLSSYTESYSQSPYVFMNINEINGNVLRNEAEVDISVNGTNPLKSLCSLWVPALQYAVIVESNLKYADSKPRFGNTPFYLIGSSFPSKQYFGGKGTKLPVIGVCSRQFSSFGFAFDLSESAITYTIDQSCTITSIRTKIYNNDFTEPQNLDDNSSVIYVITRNSYYKPADVKELEEAEKEVIAQNAPIQYMPEMFESNPQSYVYEAPLYLIESDDEE